MKKTRIIIVDDHGLVRAGFASMLKELEQVEIVDAISSGEEAIQLSNEKKPDVILMDIVMRGMSGIEATRWIKEQNPQIKIILISGEVNKELVKNGLNAGMDGYMHKDSSKDDVLWALQTVMRGEKYLSREVNELVLKGLNDPPAPVREKKLSSELTKRETEILQLLASGKSIKDIADELCISARTVETHKLNIQGKLNLANTAQLVRYAIENKML